MTGQRYVEIAGVRTGARGLGLVANEVYGVHIHEVVQTGLSDQERPLPRKLEASTLAMTCVDIGIRFG